MKTCLARGRLRLMPGPIGREIFVSTKGSDLSDVRSSPEQHMPICPTGARAAKLSIPLTKNNSLYRKVESAVRSAPSCPARGASRERHDTRGGMRWTRGCRKTSGAFARTAKSYGPDAPMQASSLRRCWRIAWATVTSRGSPGRLRISRQTIARGRPGFPAVTCGRRALRANVSREDSRVSAGTRPSPCPLLAFEGEPAADPRARRAAGMRRRAARLFGMSVRVSWGAVSPRPAWITLAGSLRLSSQSGSEVRLSAWFAFISPNLIPFW